MFSITYCLDTKICSEMWNKYFKFVRFPNDEIKKNKWMVACNIKLLLPSYTVCSDHFLSQDYNLKGILKKYAIPK